MSEEEKVVAEGWLTTAKAEELTGYTPEWLRRLARNGKVKSEKVADRLLFEKASLIEYQRQMKELGTGKHGLRYGEKQGGRR